MQIHELNPNKRYLISVPDADHVMTADDLNHLQNRLKANCLDAVVVVGADVSSQRSYFGLYCEQCGTWLPRPDGSTLFYPAPEIANAHLNDPMETRSNWHLWQVQQFGKEERVAPENLPAGAALCPYRVSQSRLRL